MRFAPFLTFFQVSLMTLLSSCSQPAPSSSTVLAEGENRPGKDVAVLQAWIGQTVGVTTNPTGGFSANFAIHPNDCSTTERHTYPSASGGTYDYVVADCSAAIQSAAKLPNFPDISPMLKPALHEWEVSAQGTYSRTGMCELMEFRTVTPNDVIGQPTFEGIGFFLGGISGAEYFVAKAKLHKVGDVTLADGRPGSVHRFISQGFCFGMGGNGGSIYSRKYVFKPFARFVSSGQTFNIWDDVANYFIGRKDNSEWVQSFDRQSELLKSQ